MSGLSFLEKIFEGSAGVIGAKARRSRRLFFARHANFVERALVARVFLRDSLFHRLHAFESAARIEIAALLAGMQFKSAFRARALSRSVLQNGSALRTTGNRACPRHIDRTRSEGIISFCRTSSGARLPGAFSFVVAILISRLTVFRHGIPPQARSIVHPTGAEQQAEDAVAAPEQGTKFGTTDLLAPQFASLRRNSCSSMRYLNALRPSMKTTGTSSLNWRRSSASASTSISLQVKPPRRESLDRLSLTTS